MREIKPINRNIGHNIKCIRQQAGLTQEQLAEILELGDKHLSAIERGVAGLSLPVLVKLCDALSVTADSVLFGSEDADDDRALAVQLMTERLQRLPDKQFDAAKKVLDALFAAMDLQQDIK